MAAKREKNFSRSYSDSTSTIEVSHEDDVVASVTLDSIHEDVKKRAAMRYIADIIVGAGNAAMKAEGGTPEKAQAKMQETAKALQDGTFTFRAASSDSLSLEDEQGIMADTIVALGKADTRENALAKVVALYGKTKQNAKGNTTRPDYNALRNVPQIKAALAEAGPKDNALDSLLA